MWSRTGLAVEAAPRLGQDSWTEISCATAEAFPVVSSK